MNTTITGNKAESAVAKELIKMGYAVLSQNWKTVSTEIDIVAKKDTTLYFVEVKYRRTNDAGDGFEAITSTKLTHMQRAAETYVLSVGWQGGYELLAASVSGNTENLSIDIREI